MRLSWFNGKNSLLSETQCRCRRGGEAGITAIRQQSGHDAIGGDCLMNRLSSFGDNLITMIAFVVVYLTNGLGSSVSL